MNMTHSYETIPGGSGNKEPMNAPAQPETTDSETKAGDEFIALLTKKPQESKQADFGGNQTKETDERRGGRSRHPKRRQIDGEEELDAEQWKIMVRTAEQALKESFGPTERMLELAERMERILYCAKKSWEELIKEKDPDEEVLKEAERLNSLLTRISSLRSEYKDEEENAREAFEENKTNSQQIVSEAAGTDSENPRRRSIHAPVSAHQEAHETERQITRSRKRASEISSHFLEQLGPKPEGNKKAEIKYLMKRAALESVGRSRKPLMELSNFWAQDIFSDAEFDAIEAALIAPKTKKEEAPVKLKIGKSAIAALIDALPLKYIRSEIKEVELDAKLKTLSRIRDASNPREELNLAFVLGQLTEEEHAVLARSLKPKTKKKK